MSWPVLNGSHVIVICVNVRCPCVLCRETIGNQWDSPTSSTPT